MASKAKAAQTLARQYFSLSLVDGSVSAERVAGILEYVEKHNPPDAVAVLKAYRRLMATEIARGVALVEHAGPVDEAALSAIAAAMTRRYGRRVTAARKDNPALLAGLRIHVGDDIFESSVAAQLASLAASV
jgi:F-type H+-transporting ATPase subunit delta